MDQIPIFALLVATAATLFLATEVGHLLGNRYHSDKGLEKYPLESSANNSIFGLLAFILAFAFGVSSSRFAELRDLAREDTDAIDGAYLAADFLDNPVDDEARDLLYNYHSTRIEAIGSRDIEKLNQGIAKSEQIHDKLWGIAVESRKESQDASVNFFVNAVNTLMETHTVRVNKAFVTRLPSVTWYTLGALLVLSHLMLGFTSGLHGRRSRFTSSIIIASFSMVAIMIVDLDRPVRSLFRSEDPLSKKLLEKMTADQEISTNPEVDKKLLETEN